MGSAIDRVFGSIELAPERWQRIYQMLELVKQEGDVEYLRAMEDLLESCIAWRAFGVAWRNLAETWDQDRILRAVYAERDRLQIAHDGMLRQHLMWFDEAKKAHAEAAAYRHVVETAASITVQFMLASATPPDRVRAWFERLAKSVTDTDFGGTTPWP